MIVKMIKKILDNKEYFLGIVLGVSLWVVDTILDHIINISGTKYLVLTSETQAILDKSLDFLIFIAFSLIVQFILIKNKKFKEKSNRNEESFKNIFEQSPIGIQLFDINGKLINYNKMYLDIFGIYDEYQYANSNLFNDLSLTNEMKNEIKQGKSLRYETLFSFDVLTKYGNFKSNKKGHSYLDILISPIIIHNNNKINGYLVQIQDITSKKATEKELAESELLFRTIFEESEYGICIVNSEAKIVLVNKKICTLTGYSISDLLDMNIVSIIGTNVQFETIYDSSEAVINIHEIIYKSNDNSTFMGEISIYSVVINNEKFLMVLIQDISKNVKAEKELKELYDKLEMQNDELQSANEELTSSYEELERMNEELNKSYNELETKNTDLEKAKQIAEKASKVKSEFLANISHELRTPLTGILGNTQFLLMKKGSDEESIENLNIINECGERLLTIIQDILNIATIESGNLTYIENTFSIKELILTTADLLEREMRQKGIRLLVSVPDILIRTDKSKLRQIIFNIISNSIKFTEKGSIEISLVLKENQLVISIIDTGIGIAKENQNNIFEPFYQIDSGLNKKYQGVGLGLSIAKRLIESIGGTINIESDVGKGTKVTFSIDIKYNIDNEYQDSIKSLQFPSNLKILLVEDDRVSVALLVNFFNDFGIDYLVANNGEQAINILNNNNDVNLILLDLQMPIMNGYETLFYIKSRKDLSKIPIIVITAFYSDEEKKKCFQAGSSDYLSKPFTIVELATKIHNWIK